MGVDIHFVLERRVPDKATRGTKATLQAIAPHSTLPTEVVEHCAAHVSETHEWLPCRYMAWLTVSDADFARSATTFHEVRAASIL